MTGPDGDKLGPVDHLARHPLPWRAPHLTECGKPLNEIEPDRVITRDAVRARINSIGKHRAAFTLCITCLSTTERHPETLIDALHREAGYVAQEARYPASWRRAPQTDGPEREKLEKALARTALFLAEIEAVQALVAAHRAEFDSYVQGVGETESLDQRRAARRLRQARAAHPRSVL